MKSNQPRHDRCLELRHVVGEICNMFHAEVQALGAEGVEKHRDVCQREALRYVERPVVFGHNSRRQSLSQLHLLLEQLREWLAKLSQRDEPTLRLEDHINSFAGHSEEAQLRGDSSVCWATRFHEMPQQAIQA